MTEEVVRALVIMIDKAPIMTAGPVLVVEGVARGALVAEEAVVMVVMNITHAAASVAKATAVTMNNGTAGAAATTADIDGLRLTLSTRILLGIL